MAVPQEAVRADQHNIPRGFEQYLGTESLPIISSRNLLPDLRSISYFNSEQTIEALELANHLRTLHYLELEQEGHTRRGLVLMEDRIGNQSMVVVCRDTRYPQNQDPAYGNLRVIGGCGLYDTPSGENPLQTALAHTKLLSVVMTRKNWMAGLELGGMKATIPGESDWEKSIWLQRATGFLFSPRGPFKDAITGSDARQTPGIKGTLGMMAKGSEIGGDHQVAGMIEALDTPASCKYSLLETYLFLERSSDSIPSINGSTVLIEGFGRIGRTAVRLMLGLGAKIILSDPLLTNEIDLLPKDLRENPEKLAEAQQKVKTKLDELIKQYGKEKITVVETNKLVSHEGDIYCPCSTSEGTLTEEKLNQLQRSGVRVILSGANNPFGKEHVWERAKRAAELGTIMPPEILSNCGSVTAAAMEPIFRARLARLLAEDSSLTEEEVKKAAEVFAAEVVIPHIEKNTDEKFQQLMGIRKNEEVNLYTAGEIAFRKACNIPYKVVNGILTD